MTKNFILIVIIIMYALGCEFAAATPLGASTEQAGVAGIQQLAQEQLRKNHDVGQALLASAISQTSALEQYEAAQQKITADKVNTYVMPDMQAYASAAETIHLLGMLRDEHAIPFLIDHIGFQDLNASMNHSPRKRLPCMGALIEIGAPAFPLMTEKIAVPGSDVRHLEAVERLTGIAMVHLIGRPAATAYVRSKISEHKDALQHQRLMEWLGIIQSLSDTMVN